MSGSYPLKKAGGGSLRVLENDDGTTCLVVALADNPALTAASDLSTFALTKAKGGPLKVIENCDGTSTLIMSLLEVGNIWSVASGQYYQINSNRENICTAFFDLEGTIAIQGQGRLTII